ncbi:hypothetical protein [Nocardia cyriacigeorgica]|jgi:hypothetical protein|uniref:hypothetical protein n=1 Tax=Nocardia cyriacigeorgica TaxID=135487 RepID=UPI001895A56D|nr:hypothetical protein [Nocardia cyriacigeorgica]MBF6436703.1 hypothetical protein [Nocardia cyriacigeorgica]MBF6452272.1 hypothetical protein [Nocardia cyriacigeorgica]MBF6481558.1 hypothetical protein [Nocardia cyriacigeorgica]MBF6549441.1 hypothetical protein [Nocardia cyriacigeorgica]
MRSITNSAVLAAVSVGVLMGAAGQASAETPHRPGPVSESTGSSSGSAGPLLKALLCALQGGVTGSHETSPPTCYLPTA